MIFNWYDEVKKHCDKTIKIFNSKIWKDDVEMKMKMTKWNYDVADEDEMSRLMIISSFISNLSHTHSHTLNRHLSNIRLLLKVNENI